MEEEIQAECIRTIERGAVDDSFGFSRRHRWKPLASDIQTDHAVVLVATRGKRTGGSIRAHLFSRRHGHWVRIGAGGAGGDRSLPSRPAPGERWFRMGSQGSALDRDTRWPQLNQRVSYLVFQVADGVSHARWRGHRREVPDHGFVCVVWRGRALPTVELFREEGVRVDEVGREAMRNPVRRLPLRVLLRSVWFHRLDRGGWFNYAPRGR